MAGAALVADAAELQVAQGGRTGVDGAVDMAFGLASADADDHGFSLRLSLSLHIMPGMGAFVKTGAKMEPGLH